MLYPIIFGNVMKLMNINESKKYIFRIVLIALLLKIGYIFLFCIPFWLGKGELYERKARYFEKKENLYTISHLFHRNDSGFYQDIAENQYTPISLDKWAYPNLKLYYQQGKYAFFPFMPFLISVGMKLPGVDFISSANIFSFIISILGFLLFFFLAQNYFKNNNIAYVSTLALMLFPFHFYFSMIYTEGIFLALLLMCFICINKKLWYWLALFSSCLVLTRANGIIMGLPFLIYFLEQYIDYKNIKIKNLLPVLSFALPMFLTFIIYAFFQYEQTGTYLAFSKVQELWSREFTFPLTSLFDTGDWRNQIRSFYVVFFMLFAIVSYKKIPLSFQVLIWINLLLPLAAGSNMSMPRFISVLFPFSLIIGWHFSKLKLKYIILTGLTILHFWSFYYWIISDPFSY